MLKETGSIRLPPHPSGGFDHADVHAATGRVFIAHTANGTIDVIDVDRSNEVSTIAGCPEGSGVLCAQQEGWVFAAARANGDILQIDALTGAVLSKFQAGTKPNGLAWDDRRQRLLVADVGDNKARVAEVGKGVTGQVDLPGRPRWCAYDATRDSFLVNIREPALLLEVSAGSLSISRSMPVSSQGPHGLGVADGKAYIACDGKQIVSLDLATGLETGSVPIAGEPDVVWLNQAKKILYCNLSRPGVVEVINYQSMTHISTFETEEGAHTSAFSLHRQRLYVLLPRSCRALVLEDV